MLIVTARARVLDTNCYVVIDEATNRCVVVDAGAGVFDAIVQIVDERQLSVVAILATHGHVDHTFDAARLSDKFGVPFVFGASDMDRLADPIDDLGPDFDAAFAAMVAPFGPWHEPSNVVSFEDWAGDGVVGAPRVGELALRPLACPGHTAGSTLIFFDDVPSVGSILPPSVAPGGTLGHTVLSGDVLFASSIGRCDLPGGDFDVMEASLRDVVGQLPADSLVMPGHGPISTMAHERRTNPYLRGR